MQDENFASTNREDYWDKPESVAKYSAEPFLYRGERSALSSCFPVLAPQFRGSIFRLVQNYEAGKAALSRQTYL